LLRRKARKMDVDRRCATRTVDVAKLDYAPDAETFVYLALTVEQIADTLERFLGVIPVRLLTPIRINTKARDGHRKGTLGVGVCDLRTPTATRAHFHDLWSWWRWLPLRRLTIIVASHEREYRDGIRTFFHSVAIVSAWPWRTRARLRRTRPRASQTFAGRIA